MSVPEILCCPHCRHPLADLPKGPACPFCSAPLATHGGIPILVSDEAAVQAAITEAKEAGRVQWYEESQAGQFTGIWRHHLKKRRAYCDGVLSRFAKGREGLIGLDMGCGDGFNLPWVSQYCSATFGSDYNMVRLERAAQTVPFATLFMADVTDYPAQDESFDFIFFNHVLEHIPNDMKALREVRRILKKGGMLLLGVPNEGAAFWKLAFALQPTLKADCDHVNFYTGRDLARKCEEAGFQVEELKYIGWGVPHWTLDSLLRRYKFFDDAFEIIGKSLFPSQATSLYLVLR